MRWDKIVRKMWNIKCEKYTPVNFVWYFCITHEKIEEKASNIKQDPHEWNYKMQSSWRFVAELCFFFSLAWQTYWRKLSENKDQLWLWRHWLWPQGKISRYPQYPVIPKQWFQHHCVLYCTYLDKVVIGLWSSITKLLSFLFLLYINLFKGIRNRRTTRT
jgi:hypothetical protein